MTIPVTEQRKQNIIQAFGNYSKLLFNFIRGRVNTQEDAEDILQDVWYQFSQVMSTRPVEQTTAWLYRVARNRITDQYRRKKPVSLDEHINKEDETDIINYKSILLSEEQDPESSFLKDIFWEQLFAALDELPEEQREVFILNELEDIPFQKIAAVTGEKVNTLISRKRYAVLHLRKRLEQSYKEIIQS